MKEHVYTNLEIPEEKKDTAVSDEQGAYFYDLIRTSGFTTTLETGFGYGKSAAFIMLATQAKHVAIDPYQDGFNNLGVRNIEKMNLLHQLDLRRDFSHNALPELLREKRTFDFIFIDGDHKYDGIFVDYYYSDLLLNPGGVVIFHDTWMRSTSLVESFVRRNRKDYEPMKPGVKNLAVFRKTGTDQRSWLHFKEFYSMKSLLSNLVASYRLT